VSVASAVVDDEAIDGQAAAALPALTMVFLRGRSFMVEIQRTALLIEATLQPVFRETAGVVLELSEDGVAELLVEIRSLKGEGIEEDADASAGESDLLGLAEESGAEALAAELGWDEEEIDKEPVVAGTPP
jgi:hypothetical protein